MREAQKSDNGTTVPVESLLLPVQGGNWISSLQIQPKSTSLQ